jgi:predicted amidohydrolase YtcJ
MKGIKMKKLFAICIITLGMISLASCVTEQDSRADIVFSNAEIYTMEEDQPWASAVVITGNTIRAVLSSDDDIEQYIGPETRVIDLNGAFVLPGFIDGHVHFNNAGSLILDVNLLTVSDDEGLRKEIQRVVANLRPGEWITGGLWGAYEQWALGAAESTEEKKDRWEPNRVVIDDLSPDNPCLLNNFNRELYLANTAAIIAAGLDSLQVEGMQVDDEGQVTGLIYAGSPAIDIIQAIIPDKSHARLMRENRAALKHLAECGIVEIHDIAVPDQTERFVELEKAGGLTCRVLLRPDLSRGAELKESALTMGLHPETNQKDQALRYGPLKGYVDGIMGSHGALFFEPYNDQPDNYGHYRRHTSDDPEHKEPNLEKLYSLLKIGYDAGFVANVHAIGTKGVSILLDTVERLKNETGKDLRGFRVIHAQVIRPDDFPRFRNLNIIAEVNPYHISDDMRWMEERIGHERCKGAYAFKSLLNNGAILSFGSDWPGTNAAEYHCHPKYLLHAAVNRTTLNGEPEGGWFPEQKISMHEALKAYTINNAYAAFEDDIRGSIKTGKLADITVCDRNLMSIDPSEILDMEILLTMVDGKIVFERSKPE